MKSCAKKYAHAWSLTSRHRLTFRFPRRSSPHRINKILPVVIIFYYLFALNSPDNDVMQGSRRLPAIASSGEAGGHLFWLVAACLTSLQYDICIHIIICPISQARPLRARARPPPRAGYPFRLQRDHLPVANLSAHR